MNKHSMRWISLILSVAVMIGSLTYIAAGINAETSGEQQFIISQTGTAASGYLLDTDNIISTDMDRMPEGAGSTWVYETVLREDDYLVNENGVSGEVDVYLDIVPTTKTSVELGENIGITVTMENTTANDTQIDSATKNPVSTAVDVESISFSLAYDATYLKFVSGESNIDGVEFTATGTGSGAAVQISYASGADKPKLMAHEMPVFNLKFEAIKENASGNTDSFIEIEDSTAITPAKLKVASSEAEQYKIYSKNGNNALTGLDVKINNKAYTGSADKVNSPYIDIILNPDFDSETNDYFITVPYDTEKSDISIDAVTAGSGASVEMVWPDNDSALEPGINKCIVRVKAKSGATQDYNLTIKKLTLDTLADPQTTLTKTVKIINDANEPTNITYNVSYKIDGTNDILAEGNDYVVYISSTQVNKPDVEAIRGVTANLEDSTLTVIDMSLSRPQIITYDLSSPSLEAKSEPISGTIDPEKYILASSLENKNRYLIMTGRDVTETEVTERTGYTEILIPDDTSMTQNIMEAGIDNTAAEFVFIVDFSSVKNGGANQSINYALVESLFGYVETEANGTVKSQLGGYIQQIKDMLSNDSTAKVTIIAVGADIGAGSEEQYWEDYYGVDFVNVPSNSDAVLTDSYKYDYTNSVYRGQTYVVPQADNEIWGRTESESEQHNIWEYCKSFNLRNLQNAPDKTYLQAESADSELLTLQFDAAMLEAKELLAGANNPQLIVLTPNETAATRAFSNKIGTSSGIESTIIPVGSYSGESDEYKIAKEVYNDLVMDTETKFNCDPADNSRAFNLVDEINSKVYKLAAQNDITMSLVDATVLPIKNDSDVGKVDITYYLPAIGSYSLYTDHNLLVRWSQSLENIDTDNHYYPISNTVKTQTDEDNETLQDDIPAVAPSYEDEHELTVTKGIVDFDDINAVKPEESKITYVLLYTNTGTETLTKVGITDSQIMLAGSNYKVYLLKNGKTAPDSTDYPVNISFSSAGGNKGESTINKLEPGESIYVEYTITVPEAGKVTTGTTRVSANDTSKIITSYLIDNIATGTAEEVDVVTVELKVEFEYDKDSGGTVSTTTSTTLPLITGYSTTPSTTTTTRIVGKEDVPTGESSVGYIVAMSLLFGAIGVFGVTVYGMVLDKRIEEAAAASGRKRIN